MARCISAIAAGLFALLVGTAAGAKGSSPSDALEKAEEQYLDTDFDDALKTLKKALRRCKVRKCSKSARAKLHILRGLVLAAGKRELDEAKEAFVEALELDSDAEPSSELMTTEVEFAYAKAQKELGLDGDDDDDDDSGDDDDDDDEYCDEDDPDCEEECDEDDPDCEYEECDEDDPDCEEECDADDPECEYEDEDEEEEDPGEPIDDDPNYNWFSVTFAPDIAFLSSDTDICTQVGQSERGFACAREDVSLYDGKPTIGEGNNINGGPVVATMRIMVGYDRILGDNFSLGARVGFAFNTANVADTTLIPVHAEARVGYWFRDRPFEFAIARPYLWIGGGMAQVDAGIDVEVLEDGDLCAADDPVDPNSGCTESTGTDPNRIEPRIQVLRAYKLGGPGFVAAGAGLSFSPIPLMMFGVGVRFGVTFPVVVPILTPEVNLGFGF